jgi:hypothetical protein
VTVSQFLLWYKFILRVCVVGTIRAHAAGINVVITEKIGKTIMYNFLFGYGVLLDNKNQSMVPKYCQIYGKKLASIAIIESAPGGFKPFAPTPLPTVSTSLVTCSTQTLTK